MKANCDNPSCKSIVDTNKIHIIRYDKVTDYKMHFCTENCDIVHKYIFDKNERYNFHKIADIWKKQIEKDFRAFYDYMPESYFKFFIKEKEIYKKNTEDKIVTAILNDSRIGSRMGQY